MPKLTIEPAPLRQQSFAPARGRDGWASEGCSTQATASLLREEAEHRRRVLDMALHAQRQRLDALQEMEGVGRRHAGAEIAQAFGARPHDEGRRAELLGEVDAVIAGIGLGQRREFAGGLPVEAAAVDERRRRWRCRGRRSIWSPNA